MNTKPRLTIKIIKENNGYSAYTNAGDKSINTCGDTFSELNDMILDAVNLAFEEEGIEYQRDEIDYEYDLESFFSFYKVINVKALSERIGMNQSLLSQYINGSKKPSPSQIKKILQGVQQIGKELSEVRFIM